MIVPELLRETRPKARKEHRCSSCTGLISVGQEYDRDTLVHDGQVYDWKTCMPCFSDGVTNRVAFWAYADEGVTAEMCVEWAEDQAVHGEERDKAAARAFLRRAGIELEYASEEEAGDRDG